MMLLILCPDSVIYCFNNLPDLSVVVVLVSDTIIIIIFNISFF